MISVEDLEAVISEVMGAATLEEVMGEVVTGEAISEATVGEEAVVALEDTGEEEEVVDMAVDLEVYILY